MTLSERELDSLEAGSYAISARRELVAARPPRRESPRFDRRGASSGGSGGMHKRHNKRWGM